MTGDDARRRIDEAGEWWETGAVVWRIGRMGVCLAVIALAGLSPAPLEGQEGPAEVAERCAVPELEDFCYGLALALQAARAGVGLAAAGGVGLPAATGTLEGVPRFAANLRVGRTRAPVHSALDGFETEHESASITAVRAAVEVGVFDGFDLAPDVGGVLSLDLMADFSWVVPPNRPDGNFFTSDDFRAWGFGIGLRMGVIGESSSRPGVTVSVARRWLGDTHYTYQRDAFEFGNAWTDFETVVTSVRGVLSKNFSGQGLVGGMGWDRYEGVATLTATSAANDIDASGLRSGRLLFFLGLSIDVLGLQVSGEGGWAHGFDDEPTLDGRFDPSSETFWASVGLGVVF